MSDTTKKFRLYIDESGTHDYSKSEDLKHRYLGLIGLIVSEEENLSVLQPRLQELKRMFTADPDELPVFHREDIIAKRGAFAKLQEQEFENEFNDAFLSLIDDLDFRICAVVLDKKSHLDRYQKAAFHPYHYCLTVLLERYVFYLSEVVGRGDVMAEARGKKEDQALEAEHQRFYQNGTHFCKPAQIQQRLTSKEIKMKPKSKMISGLEFADLLSLAAKLDVLHSYGKLPALTDNFSKVIIGRIQAKYRTSPGGNVMGFGKKLIS